MSFTSALTFDFEVYSAAQKRWLEVSSVSNFETFQANRLKLRYKDSNGKNHLAHTLNGSSLALPRVLAGILENRRRVCLDVSCLRGVVGFDPARCQQELIGISSSILPEKYSHSVIWILVIGRAAKARSGEFQIRTIQ